MMSRSAMLPPLLAAEIRNALEFWFQHSICPDGADLGASNFIIPWRGREYEIQLRRVATVNTTGGKL